MGVNIFVKINATKPKEKNFSALAVEADDSSSKLPLSNRISIIILGIVNKATDAGIANSKAYIIVFSQVQFLDIFMALRVLLYLFFGRSPECS